MLYMSPRSAAIVIPSRWQSESVRGILASQCAMSASAPRPTNDRWRDAEGTHLSLFRQVEQVTQSTKSGALHPGTLTALRFVLIHHQPSTRTGCCLACRRRSWRHLWRRRRFPCVV